MNRAGFLAEILAHPDDDAVRSIFADWLEDHGESEADRVQAEFIRTQLALAHLPLDAGERPEREAREQRLLQRWSKTWVGRDRRKLRGWGFRRGLVGAIQVSAGRFLSHASELAQRHPIEALHLSDLLPSQVALAEHPGLGRVRELLVGEGSCHSYAGHFTAWNAPSFAALRALLGSPNLAGLRSLSLVGLKATEGLNLATALSGAKGLEELVLAGCGWRAGHLEWRRFPALRRLGLIGSFPHPGRHPTQRGRATLNLTSVLPRLEALEMSRCNVSVRTLSTWSAVPRTCPLRELRLRGNPLRGQLGEAFRLPLFAAVQHLDLSECGVANEEISALVRAKWASGLVRLDLGDNPLTGSGIEVLASAGLERLTHLGLGGRRGPDGADAVAALASARLPRLVSLDLSQRGLTPNVARALARSPLAERLRWLGLRGNHFGDRGATELLRGGWPNLVRLNVRDTRLSPAGKQALRERFGSVVWF